MMQLNYFGPVTLILRLLADMRARRSGKIVNVSTLGVQTNAPKKASAASEFSVERWVHEPLRRKASQSGGGATAEQQLWPI
jgi:short-subunit dehydrogenase